MVRCVIPLRASGSLRLCGERIRVIQHEIPWLIIFFTIHIFLFNSGLHPSVVCGDMPLANPMQSTVCHEYRLAYCHQNVYSLTEPHQYPVLSPPTSLTLIQVLVIVLRRVIAPFWKATTSYVEVIVPTMQSENTSSSQWLVLVLHATTPLWTNHAYSIPSRPCSYIF